MKKIPYLSSCFGLTATFLILNLIVPVSATTVRMQTVLGDIDIELFDDTAPQNVANFLNYVNGDDYNGTFIHRAQPGFVVQGGGFILVNGAPTGIPLDPPVVNEFSRSNLRGTVAMAKPAGNPDSATSQWFFNLADNSAILDDQNGGFTVFGQVIGNGMAVVDAIAALPRVNAGAPFDSLPVRDFTGGTIELENLVNLTDVAELEDNPGQGSVVINPGFNGSWFNSATSGQGFFLDVLPTTGLVFLSWFTYDTSLADDSLSAVVGHPGHRWLTATGAFEGDTATLDITLTRGGIFDDPTTVTNSEAGTYGSITLTFTDCNNGELVYSFDESGLSGTIPITRLLGDNIALCEELSSQATR